MNPEVASKRRRKATKERRENEEASDNQSQGRTRINVGEAERQFSMIGGSVLAVCGLLRGSVSGLALAALGGALIYRGHTGHCAVYEAMGHNSAEGGADRNNEESRSEVKLEREYETSPQPS